MKTAFSARFRFSDWPNPHVPDVAAGVYAIWHDEQLIYCGMSGRELEKAIEAKKSRYGLVTRLESHSRGRLSGDQFCVYVANRIVIPALKPDQIQQFSSGEISLDRLTKEHIQKHFEYQYTVVQSSRAAYALESECRRGEVFGKMPLLNPA
jgi:hypothetical protein